MLLLIKLLLAAFLLFRLVHGSNDADIEKIGLASESEDEIAENSDETRSKRLSTSRITEGLKRLKIGFGTNQLSFTDPLLGARSSSLLTGNSNRTSIFDAYGKSISTGASKGISLFSLMSPHQPSVPKVDCTKTPCAPNKEQLVGSTNSNSQKSAGPMLQAPVVQPKHLMTNDNIVKPVKFSNRITEQQRRETAALRNEIRNAISNHYFAHTSNEALYLPADFPDGLHNSKSRIVTTTTTTTTTTTPAPTNFFDYRPSNADIFSFWSSLVSGQSEKSLFPLGSALDNRDVTVGSVRSDFSYVPPPSDVPNAPSSSSYQPSAPQPMDFSSNDAVDQAVKQLMSKAAADEKNDGIVSNTVNSYANNGDGPSIEMSQVRETLVMKTITEDSRFKIGENVIAWKTLRRNSREKHALIGITNSSVLLVLEKNNVYKLQSEIPLMSTPTSFDTFTYYNHTKKAIEGVVIVSIQYEIVFLNVNEAMTAMAFNWQWPTIRPSRYIKHFSLDGNDMLLILTDSPTVSSANLYRFDMIQHEFFLRESLSLKSQAKNAAFIHAGRDIFLFFPQSSHVTVYKYTIDHFSFFVNIPSVKAEIITVFEMGGYAYVAIGGTEPKILRYHRGKFQDQTILSRNWGFVEYFLPIPARTYRDDLILLVQHRIDYGSHMNSYVEALIWNGEAFDPALAVPCIIKNQVSNMGIGCMIDQERELGIIGAATFLRKRTISVLVPRHQAPSGLFDLEFKLLPAVHTYNEHLFELYSEVVILLKTRNEILKNAEDIIKNFHPDGKMKEITIKQQKLESISANELELGAVVPAKGVLYNDEIVTKENIDRLARMVDETEKNLAQLNRVKRETIDSEKRHHLKSLDVKDLQVDYVNDIPAEEFIFIQNGNLILDGVVEVSQPIEHESEELDETLLGSKSQPVEDVQLLAEQQTIITGDLIFEEINGILWSDFIEQIVLKNLPSIIPDMEINGDLVIESSINTQSLNGQSFPGGYVIKDGQGVQTITGAKAFRNSIGVGSMDCSGLFNGVNITNIIPLSGSNFIGGTTTFRHLEVTDFLKVDNEGQISGRHLDEFLANPTINVTRQVRANCLFDSLTVEGPIFVQGTLNDIYLDSLLSDVMYKHEPMPKCNSFKKFRSISAPNIKLSSKLINGIELESFVTKDSEQTFHASKIHGNVFFNRLKLNGLFDSINVTDLDTNSVKLFGEQFTDAEFIFEDGVPLSIDATQLQITETINNISVSDFINIDADFELFENVMFDSLSANECSVAGDIISKSSAAFVNGWHLDILEKSHLSKKSNQKVQQPTFIQKAIIRGPFEAGQVNGVDLSKIINILKAQKTNEQMLNDSKIAVDKFIINGNVHFDTVNDNDFETIKSNAIRLDVANTVDVPLIFSDQITINGNMNVEHLNNVNFNAFVKDLVRRSDNRPVIHGKTIFRENVLVKGNVATDTINDISVERILTKNFKEPIQNPMRIVGDVTVPNLIVHGKLNGISEQKINEFDYDDVGQTYIIHGNVFFNKTTSIDDLHLHGGYNNVGNVKDYLNNVVRVDRPAVITGTKTFKGNLHFGNNIQILEYNSVNVRNFLSNVVLVDQFDPVNIHSAVIFEDPVTLSHVEVNGDLIVDSVNDCSLKNWHNNAIRTDQPFTYNGVITFADGTFDSSNLNTNHLNDISINELLTLNTKQEFLCDVKLEDVESTVPFETNGLVNGLFLPNERKNTLMVFGIQNITMPTIFHGARVLRNLTTVNTVNGRDLKLAASLERDIVVDSPLTFDRVSVNQLFSDDLISSINFNNWTRDVLQKNLDGRTQVVTAPWSIKTGHVSILSPETTVNGLSVNNFMQTIDAQNKAYEGALKQKCQEIQTHLDDTQNNVVYLSNFKNAFKILVKNEIKSIYLFSALKHNYLLINSGCETDTFIWNEPNQTYAKIGTADTGIVTEWIHVLDLENNLFLISNDDGSVVANSSCSNSGANIWRFSFTDQRISKEVQIGGRGDYRSLQMKPNSRAYFFVIRNINNHGIELNLRGAIEAEWSIENRESPYASFTFGDGRLMGMTHSEEKSTSTNSPCDCKRRDKRCIFNNCSIIDWESFKLETRQQFEKTANQLRSNLENSRNVLRSILNPMKDPTPKDFVGSNDANQMDTNQGKLEQLKELIRESKEKSTKLLEMASTHLNVSRNFEDPSAIAPKSDSGNENTAESVQSNIDGPLLVSIMDGVDDAIKLNPNSQNASELVPITVENTTNIGNGNALNTSDPVLGSGEKIVDLMDLIENIIEDSQQQHQEQAYENNQRPDHYELGIAINKSIFLNNLLSSSNSSVANDTQIGTLIGLFLIENTLPHKNENVSNSVSGDDDNESKNIGSLQTRISEGNQSTVDEINLKQILDLIDQAENATNSTDVQVGDAFGDLFTKAEPLADKIVDAVIEEMRRRKYDQQRRNPDMVGATIDDDNTNMSNFKILFRKIGREAIKMYTYGKDKLIKMKDLYHDTSYLMKTYISVNRAEDTKNDNKSYGPPDVNYMIYHGPQIKTDDNTQDQQVSRTKDSEDIKDTEDLEDSNDFEDIEDLNSDMKTLRASNPNADKMAKAFVIEIIKRFASEENHIDKNGTRFWKIIRKGVTSTFNKHFEGKDDVNEETDALIYEGFMRNVNATIENHKKNKTNDPVVGSTMNLDCNNNTNKSEPVLGDLFGDLFDKFTPLIDNLSDNVFEELRNRYLNNHDVNNYHPGSYRSEQDDEHKESMSKQNSMNSDENSSILASGQTNDLHEHRQNASELDSNVVENATKIGNQNESNTNSPILGSGEKIVDLMDLIDKFIENDRQKHREQAHGNNQSPYRSKQDDDEKESATELNSTNSNQNSSILDIGKTNDTSRSSDSELSSSPNKLLETDPKSETISITVGPEQKTFIIVSSIWENTIKSDHDQIQIFEDIVDGRLFQTIASYKPKSLTAFTIESDTVLAFIQDQFDVKTYVYRGIQGFVEFSSFKLANPIQKMVHNEMALASRDSHCTEHYLVCVLGKEVQFVKAITIGNCRASDNFKC